MGLSKYSSKSMLKYRLEALCEVNGDVKVLAKKLKKESYTLRTYFKLNLKRELSHVEKYLGQAFSDEQRAILEAYRLKMLENEHNKNHISDKGKKLWDSELIEKLYKERIDEKEVYFKHFYKVFPDIRERVGMLKFKIHKEIRQVPGGKSLHYWCFEKDYKDGISRLKPKLLTSTVKRMIELYIHRGLIKASSTKKNSTSDIRENIALVKNVYLKRSNARTSDAKTRLDHLAEKYLKKIKSKATTLIASYHFFEEEGLIQEVEKTVKEFRGLLKIRKKAGIKKEHASLEVILVQLEVKIQKSQDQAEEASERADY